MSRVVPDIGRLPEVTAALAARAGDVLCSRVHTPQDDSVVAAAGQAAFAAAGPADLMST